MIMQIKEKTLVEYADEFRINGTGITLGDIKSRIKETAENYGARCNIISTSQKSFQEGGCPPAVRAIVSRSHIRSIGDAILAFVLQQENMEILRS